MSTKSPECWANDPQAHGVRIEISADHSLLLPLDEFAFAELKGEGKEQELRLVFAMHETRPAQAAARRRTDWIGFALLAVFMVSLVFGLHALPHARAALLTVVGLFALAIAAFFLLLKVEARLEAPLVEPRFFIRRGFAISLSIGSLSMFGILSLLLYFNLFAQSREGLGLTALQAGASLLPLSVALLALSLSASALAKRLGPRSAMTGGMALVVFASGMIGVATSGGGMFLLSIGLFLMGVGLAIPYALAPRLALAALSPAQAGQGSGIVNACTFLGGSAGIAIGGAAFAIGDFTAVLAMIGVAGIFGAVLGRGISEAG